MKKLRQLLTGLAIFLATGSMAQSTVLQGTITSNTTLTNDKVWTLKGYVKVDSNVTLTIQPGTIIRSDIAEKGALIITRGAKIDANGTKEAPIVFTSGLEDGARRPGDWGGLVILGSAPTNRSTPPTIEGGLSEQYGGSNANDNSGTLRYVIVEFAGIAAAPGSEINAVTLGGVGSGTTIEYVMTSYGNDDGFEFFGGTVNCKYLISFATADDDFDFDFGYTGKIQYAIAYRDPSFVDGGDAGNGIECDNDGQGTAATPTTRPILSNFTFMGADAVGGTVAANHNYANRWRRSSNFVLANSIIAAFPDAGLSLESAVTAIAYKNGTSLFKNNIIQAAKDVYRFDSSGAYAFASNAPSPTKDSTSAVRSRAATEAENKAASEGTTKVNTVSEIQLTNVSALKSPNFSPQATSIANLGASFVDADLANTFFTPTAFRGAVGSTNNWVLGWTNFDPVGKLSGGTTTAKNTKAVSGINVYPNPINVNSRVEFVVENGGNYTVTLVDITGKVISTLHNGALNSGINTLTLNNASLLPGIYFVNFNGNNGASTVKVQVL